MEDRYNVHCVDCGQVFSPAPKTPLWWQAKQRADKGFLDALNIRKEKCGCGSPIVFNLGGRVPAQPQPNAPFRVFGYDDECREFDLSFTTFTGAVRKFLEMNRRGMYVLFIEGVSDAVKQEIVWL